MLLRQRVRFLLLYFLFSLEEGGCHLHSNNNSSKSLMFRDLPLVPREEETAEVLMELCLLTNQATKLLILLMAMRHPHMEVLLTNSHLLLQLHQQFNYPARLAPCPLSFKQRSIAFYVAGVGY
jgi:hypothetical protein